MIDTIREHALLGASNAHRWTRCPASARLEELINDTDTTYAQEGTQAHKLAEMVLTDKTPREDLENCPNEMNDAVLAYVDYVEKLYKELKEKDVNAVKEHEVKVNFAKYVPEGFGTADTVLISEGVMHVIDFKYGQGVKVNAPGNDQLRCYAIGALEEYDYIFDIKTVVVHIIQPRLDNYSTETIDAEDLKNWARALKKLAEVAFSGEGNAYPGDHCQFCKVRSICKARANRLNELTEVGDDFKLLSNEDIVRLWPMLDDTEKFIKNIKQYVLEEMLKGHKINGLKLVEGRSQSKYTNELAITKTLTDNGYEEPLFTKKSLIGLTEMKKLLGAKKYRELLEGNGLIVKSQGSPKVALADDPGKEYVLDVTDDEFEVLA